MQTGEKNNCGVILLFLDETHELVKIGDFGVATQYCPGDEEYEYLGMSKGDYSIQL